MKYTVDNKEYEIKIKDKISYGDMVDLIRDSVEANFDTDGSYLYGPFSVTFDIMLLKYMTNIDRKITKKNRDSAEFMWKFISETTIIDDIHNQNQGLCDRLITSYHEALKIKSNPLNRVADIVAGIGANMTEDLNKLNGLDISALSSAVDKLQSMDEKHIIDTIVDKDVPEHQSLKILDKNK